MRFLSPEIGTVTTNSHVSIGVSNFKIIIEAECIENIETEIKETLKISIQILLEYGPKINMKYLSFIVWM